MSTIAASRYSIATDRRSKNLALLVAALFTLGVIFIMFLVNIIIPYTVKVEDPPLPEEPGGIEVDFGNSATGSGTVEPMGPTTTVAGGGFFSGGLNFVSSESGDEGPAKSETTGKEDGNKTKNDQPGTDWMSRIEGIKNNSDGDGPGNGSGNFGDPDGIPEGGQGGSGGGTGFKSVGTGTATYKPAPNLDDLNEEYSVIKLKLFIDKTGQVYEVQPISFGAASKEAQRRSLDAAKKWKFTADANSGTRTCIVSFATTAK